MIHGPGPDDRSEPVGASLRGRPSLLHEFPYCGGAPSEGRPYRFIIFTLTDYYSIHTGESRELRAAKRAGFGMYPPLRGYQPFGFEFGQYPRCAVVID